VLPFITFYLWFVLSIGFFDKQMFVVAGAICFLLAGIAIALLVTVDRLVGRILLVLNGLVLLYWVSGIVSLWRKV
jgi:hypothetical protein